MYKKIGELVFWQSEHLNRRGVVHGFTLRSGGVSEGAFESLNIGQRRGDDMEKVRENISRAVGALGIEYGKLTVTLQEHTDNIVVLDEAHVGCGLTKVWNKSVDGIISALPGVPLMCYCADCVPIILYSSSCAGVIHAGWRGSAKLIAQKAVRIMRDLGAKDIYALIGPSIRACCYEVGEDVAAYFPADTLTKTASGKFMLDLAAANKKQLIQGGAEVEDCNLCTSCNNDIFFSHRAQNGVSGNIGAIVML
ncbi:MAG: peptidoglycan editing factor PgeF [Clostridia bacterium]|nr:peptidoglycan editing factor PgeF [Clostridia bacterium]